jgi:hypothetical protein
MLLDYNGIKLEIINGNIVEKILKYLGIKPISVWQMGKERQNKFKFYTK